MPKNKNNNSGGSRPGRDSQRPGSARSRRGRERHLSVRGERRETPDVQKIARAVIQMALAQAEADAQAAGEQASKEQSSGDTQEAADE